MSTMTANDRAFFNFFWCEQDANRPLSEHMEQRLRDLVEEALTFYPNLESASQAPELLGRIIATAPLVGGPIMLMQALTDMTVAWTLRNLDFEVVKAERVDIEQPEWRERCIAGDEKHFDKGAFVMNVFGAAFNNIAGAAQKVQETAPDNTVLKLDLEAFTDLDDIEIITV